MPASKLWLAGSQLAFPLDGKRVAFSEQAISGDNIPVNLFVADANGEGARALVAGGQDPSWSAAGLVAYQVETDDGWHLRVVDPNTDHDRDLGSWEFGCWSGDGSSLYVDTTDNYGTTIWQMRADGSGANVVVSGGSPDWAP